jgi:hypothetical protein
MFGKTTNKQLPTIPPEQPEFVGFTVDKMIALRWLRIASQNHSTPRQLEAASE